MRIVLCNRFSRLLTCFRGAITLFHVLHSSKSRQQPHHLIAIPSRRGSTHARLAIRTCPGNRRIANSSWYLVRSTISGGTTGNGAILVNCHHANSVVAVDFVLRAWVVSCVFHVVGFLGLHPVGPEGSTAHRGERLFFETLVESELSGLVSDEKSVESLLHDDTSYGDGVLDTSDGADGTDIHCVPIHYHSIQRRLPILVR